MLENISNSELLEKIIILKKKAQTDCLWATSKAKKNEDFATGNLEKEYAEGAVNQEWIEFVEDEYYTLVEEADNRKLKW